ncbi:MAG: DMT family transporter [Gammaproteobacteria bacterium]|nr:DMT family transporter [Gammaproteobacteria bacterium]
MPPQRTEPPRPVVGIACKIASVVLLSGMAACVKYLGSAIPSGQTIFVRGLISIAVLALGAWGFGAPHLLLTRNWRSHALRSLSGTVSMFCLFTALTLIPFADVMAITFTAPMFLTLLAMVFLGERIHAFRWSALAIGFAGVAIMVAPHIGFGSGSALGIAVAFGAAVFAALAMMFLRAMSGGGGEHAVTITFYFTVTSTAFAALTAIAGWPAPTAEQWLFIVAAGFLGVFGQLLMTFSYRYAEASTIAPLDYGNLLMAVVFGYAFFDEIPERATWIGAPLVVAAGAIILWREYRLAAGSGAPREIREA